MFLTTAFPSLQNNFNTLIILLFGVNFWLFDYSAELIFFVNSAVYLIFFCEKYFIFLFYLLISGEWGLSAVFYISTEVFLRFLPCGSFPDCFGGELVVLANHCIS